MNRARLAFFLTAAIALASSAWADKVIMKDGTVYTGKIMIDSDKAVLIGNPPFDPNSYLLESKDIATISYEEYKPNAPAERKRGFNLEARLSGNAFTSDELSLSPGAGIYGGAGFRVHPFFELEGGLEWFPALSAKDALSVSDDPNLAPGSTLRRYERFWAYQASAGGRFYPFFQKKWKAEPYFTLGYSWTRLLAKGSEDYLKGAGWHAGFGAIYPLSTHLFLEGRFIYQSVTFDTIEFIGREGSVRPEINEQRFALATGLSYRF
jgi:hypothetical protein